MEKKVVLIINEMDDSNAEVLVRTLMNVLAMRGIAFIYMEGRILIFSERTDLQKIISESEVFTSINKEVIRDLKNIVDNSYYTSFAELNYELRLRPIIKEEIIKL